jgi:branched-chain amino acid transport system permease protein
MKKTTKSNCVTFGIVIAFYLLVELVSACGGIKNSFAGQLVPICAYVILAMSLNLTVGVLGELSLGHAGFMSIGAFTGTIFWITTYGKIPVWLGVLGAMLVGAAMAGVFGLIIGVPVLRLSGDYLAIVTLAFGEIIKNVINSMYLGYDANGIHVSMKDASSMGLSPDGKTLINGAMGVTGIPKVSTFTLGIVLVLITLTIILNLTHSRSGRAIASIRDNEIAARSIGIDITKYKLMAFITSAVFAGLGGVLYALNFSSLVAKKFDYNTSITILVFVVLGGMGNIRGSIIAAAILTVLPEMLRGFSDYRMLAYSLALILIMIFSQSPELIAWRKKFTAKFKASRKQKQPKGVA